jgi:hypothetical protein
LALLRPKLYLRRYFVRGIFSYAIDGSHTEPLTNGNLENQGKTPDDYSCSFRFSEKAASKDSDLGD